MASLSVLLGPDKGRVFELSDEAPQLIGRGSPTVGLTDSSVSRRHAELRRENGRWVLADLRSSNGTFVNYKRIDAPVILRPGDRVRMGSTLMLWNDHPPPRAREAGGVDLAGLDAAGRTLDVSMLASLPSNDDSAILASPAAADAVRAWRVMSQLADAIGSLGSPDELVERVMDILLEEVPVVRGFILMRPADGGDFAVRVVRYRNPEDAHDPITTSRTIVDHVVSNRAGVLCSNALSDERFSGRRRSGSLQAFVLRSVICAPILSRDDVLGVIHLDCPMSTHIYTEDQLRLVTAIGRMAGLAIENARLVSQRLETARLAATGQTVAALSHAIKNILHGMRGGADVVEMGLARQQLATIDQGWQIVLRNVERIYTLTLNMLAYAKEREPRLELAQLNAVVKEALAGLARRAADKSVTIIEDLEEPFPAVPIDVGGIEQVVLNIVGNAIDAVARSSGVIRVRTHYDAARHAVELTIGDNGPGIAPEQLPHLFEPFKSTKGHAGTGLGLAVARKIVEEHGGQLELQCEPGQGTLARVRIPVQSGTADSGETLAPPSRPPAGGEGWR